MSVQQLFSLVKANTTMGQTLYFQSLRGGESPTTMRVKLDERNADLLGPE